MYAKVSFITLAIAATAVAQFGGYGAPPIRPVAPIVPAIPAVPVAYPPMPYEFGYGVQDAYTGNDFGHSENSDGQVVSGQYHVLLPDGRKQIVTYTAGYNGYNAEVAYEGVAHVPVPVGPIAPVGPVGPIAPRPGYGK